MPFRSLARFFVGSFFLSAPAWAGWADGMYPATADQLPTRRMKEAGLRVSPQQVEWLAGGAVVRLSSGCTATFLSNRGLLGTNWHCVEACANLIAQRARQEKGGGSPLADLLRTGYAAASAGEELACPGLQIDIPLLSANVSERFAEFDGAKLSPPERSEKIRKRKEEVREECSGGEAELVCDVVEMNTERQPYYLYKYRRVRDLRLVWIPPHVVGEFGGKKDNWEYPRQAGDFAFLRAYEEGKPFVPARFAPVSPAGVKPGDPQFILGFPAATERNTTSYAVEFAQQAALPLDARLYRTLIRTIERRYPRPSQSPYSSAWFYLQNYAENFQRKAHLLESLGVAAKKRALEAQLSDRTHLDRIADIYGELRAYYPGLRLLEFMTGRRSPAQSFLAASYIWQWAVQPSEDKDRPDDRFKSWNRDRLTALLEAADDNTSLEGEKALLASFFRFAADENVEVHAFERFQKKVVQPVLDICAAPGTLGVERVSCGALRGKTPHEQMAEILYASTDLVARQDTPEERRRALAARRRFFAMSPRDLVRTQDKLLLLAKGVVEELARLRADWEAGASYTHELSRANLAQNLLMGFDPPDANSTLRFTLGSVQESYRPIDRQAVYPFATTLSSLVAKDGLVKDSAEADYELFRVPDDFKKAQRRVKKFREAFFYDAGLKDVPVCFITSHVTAGGSSGSALFNASGHVVGFHFDKTPEGILSDVWPHPDARAINVDVRYIGFLANEIYPEAEGVLRELKLPVYGASPRATPARR